ncbi:MAG: hypothetical protein R6W82_09325 [bacterium]
MGISEIEAVEHSLRHILGEPIPDSLFREVSDEVEQGTLLGCVAQAPTIASLKASIRYLVEDVEKRISSETDPHEKAYLQAVREKLLELEEGFNEAAEPLIRFLEDRVVKGHFRLHERFPGHAHDE